MTTPHGSDRRDRVGGEATDVTIETEGLAPSRPLDDDGVERTETFLEADDGEKLFYQSWRPADGSPPRGAVALMHGYGEHSSRYNHVAAALVRAGYGVGAIDARGHGRSTGKRGYIRAFDDYLSDFDRLVERAGDQWPNRPLFVLGHSNGGLIALHDALTAPAAITGYVVTSPFLGFAVEVSAAKRAVGQAVSRMWPSLSIPSDLDPEDLSHDERVVRQYERDPLVLRTATGRWYTETLAAQRELRERAGDIEAPCLVLVAGADEIADPEATEAVFHRMSGGNREMDVYPNLRHELLNEPNWGGILERIVGWMERYRPTETTEEAA